jgi:hypothetical protein
VNEKKIIIFFCYLGLAFFLLSAIGGVLVWKNTQYVCKENLDSFITDYDSNQMVVEKDIIENYIQCSKSHSGLRSVLIHLSLATAFFSIIVYLIVLGSIKSMKTDEQN